MSDELKELSNDQRILALDGVRGLAILLVTFYRFAVEGFPESVVGTTYHSATYLGATGVNLFFVLSGFLITGILLRTRHRPDYFRRFYLRRSLRIFPLYFLSLLLLLVVLPGLLGNRVIVEEFTAHPVYLWTYTANWVMSWRNEWCFGAVHHFWSLAIEEQFYWIWPLVVLWWGPSQLVWVSMGLCVTFTVSRIFFSWMNLGEVTEKTFTLFQFDGLLLGAMAAAFFSKRTSLSLYHRPARLGCLAALGGYALLLGMGEKDYTMRTTAISLVWVFLLICAIAAEKSAIERRILESSLLRSLGKFSYAMYVFQSPLIPLLDPWISPSSLSDLVKSPTLGGAIYVGLMFAVTYLLAVLSWYGIERWCLQWRAGTISSPSIL